MHKSIMFSCKLIMTWSCLTSTKNHGIQKQRKEIIIDTLTKLIIRYNLLFLLKDLKSYEK